jgi:hypothetical protein
MPAAQSFRREQTQVQLPDADADEDEHVSATQLPATDARDADALEHFLRLSADDVRVRADGRTWTGGTTWAGLLRLMERKGYDKVHELGMAAATLWAVQLTIVRRG